jgi:hypothetical protein
MQMSNVATLALNTKTNRWEAPYQGQVLAASASKAYVISNIQEGRCNKANKAKVVDVIEVGGQTRIASAVAEVATDVVVEDRFSVNERFDFLESFVTGVAKRRYPSLIVTGAGGLGKTFTVNKALKLSLIHI